MLHEKDFEDILSEYPDLIEEGLKLKGRQVTLYGRRIDLLFEDRFGRQLLVELKAGPIKDEHIGQILSYEGMLLSHENPTIRVMLIGTRVPPNIQKSLDHHGIAWREISHSRLRAFLEEKNDIKFLDLVKPDMPVLKVQESRIKTSPSPGENRFPSLAPGANIEEFLSIVKASERYLSYKTVVNQKEYNESRAKEILTGNMGNLTPDHLTEVFNLVDEPYQYFYMGKADKHPWFGRLIKLNAFKSLKDSNFRINQWFSYLNDPQIKLENRIDTLIKGDLKITGWDMGFTTLMLYILDKSRYSVWFEPQHKGLAFIYPELGTYRKSGSNYVIFNIKAKDLAARYGFKHTELDWLFSVGVYLDK
jgi:hypothetical protein